MSTVNAESQASEERGEPADPDVPVDVEVELEFSEATIEEIEAYASHSGVSRTDAVRRIVRKHFEQTERRTIRLTAFTAGLAWVAAIGLFGATNVASVVGAIYIVVTLFWASYPLMRSS
ncbi:hypothetical protein AArcCO_1611 [Halalkaliarchaeum sp. AArc-CO]|uniref:hypothetical protein n=1 Tax=unclassified Halalkaliarchaeum TaxID=2678344 RepID=UPI00217E04C7|nr:MULTISPECIES: hypothetical protein [unclassified Halalkaliarchaeum]MDR5674195.1 hypothetical protein [Halalkaliarchaeum sp. AArc-GB]UWG50913.1 hypothetical protein AArcCO_1611 [Halalkaliarchaeum sp. AArc-CO]